MPDQLQAARDEIADMCGYRFIVDREMGPVGWELHGGAFVGDHPIPACLNFVSRVWPDGMKWSRHTYWKGGGRLAALTKPGEYDTGVEMACVDVTHDELTDRMTLLLRVLRWLRDNDRPAFDAACEKIRKECEK